MNKILLMLNLLILTPTFQAGVKFDNFPDPDVLNAPTTISLDDENVEYSLIRKNVIGSDMPYNNIDFIGSDTSMFGVNGDFVNQLNSYKTSPHRSVIGFDMAQMTSINRLTIKVEYKLYKNWDLFNAFGDVYSNTFVINASTNYEMFTDNYLKAVVSNYNELGGYSALTPKMIGKTSDLISLQDKLSQVVKMSSPKYASWDSKNSNVIWNGKAYNSTFGKFISVNDSVINDKEYYVIMPVGFDISQVWISVAGIDSNGNSVFDGLGLDGVITTDINGFKNITIKAKDFEYLYCSDLTSFVSISFIPDGNYLSPKIHFGKYKNSDNSFEESSSMSALPFNFSKLIYSVNELNSYVLVPDENIALSGDFGNGFISLSYVSNGLIVGMNIVGNDGSYLPTTETPDTSGDYWFPDILDPINKIWGQIQAVIKIVLLVVVLVATIYLISLLVKSFKNLKGDKDEKN